MVALEVAASACVSRQPNIIQRTFSILAERGANKKFQKNGKSLLFIALDSAVANISLRPLICAFMRSSINEDINLYRENGLVYSPVAYVKRGKNSASTGQKSALLDILSAFGCRDVFYHETGPQPAGWTGAPQHIVAAEQARLERIRQQEAEERAHKERIRRREEEAAALQLEQRRLRALAAEKERIAKIAHDEGLRRQKEKLELERQAKLAEAKEKQEAIKRETALRKAASRDARQERKWDHEKRVQEE